MKYGRRNLTLRKKSASFSFGRGCFSALAAIFVVDVSACGETVSAKRFRRRQNVLCGHNTLSYSETTHCPVWKTLNAIFGEDTLSSLDRTHCPLRQRHNVLFGKDS